MIKRVLCIVPLLFTIPAYSGEYEDALRTYDKLFLYMYTPNCGYCTKFEPNYVKLSKTYNKDCKFLKINAEDSYGGLLMMNLGASYVPYVVMINAGGRTAKRISPECLLKYACVNDAVQKFYIN